MWSQILSKGRAMLPATWNVHQCWSRDLRVGNGPDALAALRTFLSMPVTGASRGHPIHYGCTHWGDESPILIFCVFHGAAVRACAVTMPCQWEGENGNNGINGRSKYGRPCHFPKNESNYALPTRKVQHTQDSRSLTWGRVELRRHLSSEPEKAKPQDFLHGLAEFLTLLGEDLMSVCIWQYSPEICAQHPWSSQLPCDNRLAIFSTNVDSANY